MNWLDAVIIIVILLLGFMGWRNGLIRAAIILAGIAGGAYLAGQYYKDFADSIGFVSGEKEKQLVAFAIIFLATFVVAFIVGFIVQKVMKVLFLGWLDTLLGGVAGLLVGATLSAVMLVAVEKFDPPGLSGAMDGSALAEVFWDKYPVILGLLPDEFDLIRRVLPEEPR